MIRTPFGRWLRTVCGVALLCQVLALYGCDDRRRHQPNEEPGFAGSATSMPADAGPEAVAKAFLQSAATAQQTRAKGLGSQERRTAYDNAMAQIGQLSARELIHQRLRSSGAMTVPKDITEAAAVATVAESWVSMLGHYVDGIRYEGLRLATGAGSSPVTIYVEAENPAEARRLRELESAPATVSSTSNGKSSNVRTAAIQEGFNVPISVGIELKLMKMPEGWRVLSVSLGPSSKTPLGGSTTLQPTTQIIVPAGRP